MPQYENYNDVLSQMAHFGIKMRVEDRRSFPKRLAKRATCGQGGKYWYKLYEFERDNRTYLTGSFGGFNPAVGWQTVEMHWAPLTEAERARQKEEREAARRAEAALRAEEARLAALSAAELWATGSRKGSSAYLKAKQVEGEACRYLPDGSILIPLLRYDLPRENALRAVQRIYPGPRKHRRTGEDLPQKVFTSGFAKTGCCVRLGEISPEFPLLLVCEGYATGLSIRMATERQWPVFVALDAYNLAAVVELLRALYPDAFILICADDDWKSADHAGPNPGCRRARLAAKNTDSCEIVWPVFNARTRQLKDTDFNDLHQREGLDVVARQLQRVISIIVESLSD